MYMSAAAFALRACLALCVAFSGVIPAYAGIPAPRTLSSQELDKIELLFKVQTVDPGGGDDGGNDPSGDGRDTGGGKDSPGQGDNYEGREREELRVSKLETNRIIQDLRAIRRECGAYDEVYRIDCLRQGIDMVVASMPDGGDYKEAKSILRKTSRRLGAIVSTYQDRSAPKLVAPRNANPRFKKRRTYRAVKREALPRAMAEANAAVSEAATQLLRSAENSERRYAHYQQISTAVDSTKVLLRSG
ncbi:MAG: hypothetical protein JWL86_6301 [Rhizobium sp.]|nr:hypothetical protein [Rhizobium sp.]